MSHFKYQAFEMESQPGESGRRFRVERVSETGRTSSVKMTEPLQGQDMESLRNAIAPLYRHGPSEIYFWTSQGYRSQDGKTPQEDAQRAPYNAGIHYIAEKIDPNTQTAVPYLDYGSLCPTEQEWNEVLSVHSQASHYRHQEESGYWQLTRYCITNQQSLSLTSQGIQFTDRRTGRPIAVQGKPVPFSRPKEEIMNHQQSKHQIDNVRDGWVKFSDTEEPVNLQSVAKPVWDKAFHPEKQTGQTRSHNNPKR